jgi:hypothetical protein
MPILIEASGAADAAVVCMQVRLAFTTGAPEKSTLLKPNFYNYFKYLGYD